MQKMKEHTPLSFLLVLPMTVFVTGGCMQPFDAMAADGTKNAPPQPPEDFHTRVIETPAIDIVSGGMTSTNPCERTRFQLFNEDEELAPLGVLVQECSGCHGPAGGPVANFNFILDTAALIDPANVTKIVNAGSPFVVPGDPEHSMIYIRMQSEAMPPNTPGVTNSVTPSPTDIPATTSQTSLVYTWIADCLNAGRPRDSNGAGGSSGGGSGGDSGGGTGGATGTGGMGMGGGTVAGGRGGRGGARATGGAGGGA